MPKLRLTASAVERFQSPSSGQVEYYDTHLPAFGLRISYSGTKAWFVMTRVAGKLTRITLGRYPALSLAAARDKARLAVEHAKGGSDPRLMAAEERRRKEKDRLTTFGSVAARFMTSYVERELRPNTAREYRRILQGPDTRDWTARPISTIARHDVLELLGAIEHRGAPAAANRALAYLSKFFNWCLEQDLIRASPTTRVRPPSSPRSRDRVLTDDELSWIWRALEEFPGPFGPLFQILLLTGQRRSEVASMRWDELRWLGSDEALWDLPGTRTKNGQPHLVPLAAPAQSLLTAMPQTSPLVFTTTGSTAVSGFSRAKSLLDTRITEVRRADGRSPLPSWTLHDLRRTMVTVMNERLGVQPHVVEAVVNHMNGTAKRGVAGVYNRALYLADRRDALVAWAGYVRTIADSPHTRLT
jgi:integrase